MPTLSMWRSLSKDEGHKKGLFASLAVLAANCIKFGVMDVRVGFKPAGAIVWGLISAMGALKLKSGVPRPCTRQA